MAGAVMARQCKVAVDDDGDVQIRMVHDCGCCVTWAWWRPDQVEELVEILRFAAAQGAARKAGKLAGGEGGRA